MIFLAWTLAALWALILLAAARPLLRRLPEASATVPPYGLWLPHGGPAPPLEPAPALVHTGPEPPPTAPDHWLVLGAHLHVPTDLPGRLAACAADFVSVSPVPLGGAGLGVARERLLRDLAQPQHTLDLRAPQGFADARCAWLRRADLDLPAPGPLGPLRTAQARKAHGLPVDLRQGRRSLQPAQQLLGEALVRAPALSHTALAAQLDQALRGDLFARGLYALAPVFLCLTPMLLLLHAQAWPIAALTLGLGTAARALQANRDGFGWSGAILGWFSEIALGLSLLRMPRSAPAPMPTLDAAATQTLASAQPVQGHRWLERAAVPYLARALGGSSRVMEQLYRNAPAGRDALGRAIDRAVQASPGARALRFRLHTTVRLARALQPQRLLSVPAGSGRDAAQIGAAQTVLVDPDAGAQALAAEICPAAQFVAGKAEAAPAGPFDVILFIGLIEYLDDRAVCALLNTLRQRLGPQGTLLTSTTADYPDRVRMQRWFGWHTRPRSPEAYAQLLQATGFHVEATHSDPQGIQHVLVARPRAGAGRPTA